MRVVYFAHSVLNRGGDKMVLAHLGHLASSGHQVVIRANLMQTGFAIHPAIVIEKPSLRTKAGTLISALLERQQADCVIASIVPTAVLLWLRNRGRVLHFAQDDNETAYHSPPLRLLMRFLYGLAFSLLAIPTVAVSQALAADFRARFSADCRVVPNGVDTERFFPAPSAQLIAAKGRRKAILLLSRRDRRKGFDVGREVVVALAAAGCGPIEVWTVGEKAGWPKGAPPHRDFGSIDQEALRGIMSSADLFLCPSRSEGFGLMVLEAFACGCPVVTTKAIGFVGDEVNALVSDIDAVAALTDQAARVLKDDHLARRLAGEGLLFARTHSLRDSSVLFQSEITSLFSGKANHRGLCKEAATKR